MVTQEQLQVEEEQVANQINIYSIRIHNVSEIHTQSMGEPHTHSPNEYVHTV